MTIITINFLFLIREQIISQNKFMLNTVNINIIVLRLNFDRDMQTF